MNEAANYFVGEHDFASFMASGSKIVDTVRTIYLCNVTSEGNTVTVSIRGNGFLYNMVRIIVGTLISVSEGKILPSDIPVIIAGKDRNKAGATVPSCGLYLYSVEY
jgi:tRNA pseudouridine38-40 synthase